MYQPTDSHTHSLNDTVVNHQLLSMVTRVNQMGNGTDTCAGSSSGASSGTSSCQWSSALPLIQLVLVLEQVLVLQLVISVTIMNWMWVLVLVVVLVLVLVPAAVNGHQRCLPLKWVLVLEQVPVLQLVLSGTSH